MYTLNIGNAKIEYEVFGQGEPVLLIHGGLVADGLAYPLLTQPELASRYQLIHYHRRGYLGSTVGSEPLSLTWQASDAAALLNRLGVKTAHIAGHSIGGIIAMQLAIDAPGLVHSLTLLEPTLFMVPSGKINLERGILPMLNAYHAGKKEEAVVGFSNGVFGPDWRSILEHAVPGGVEQALKSTDTFIQDLMAIKEWQFGPQQAEIIRQPVLSVVGVLSQPFMREGRMLLHTWFPQTEDLDPQSTHLLQMQDPQGVAHGLAQFFSRHPMPAVAGSIEKAARTL